MPDLTNYEIPTEGLIFSFPARMYRPDQARVVDLLALAKADRALDPTVFDEAPPFFLTAEMSNQRLDSYYTRMDISSLNNYAEDAKAGIGLQDSHDTNRMSLGRSLTGAVEQGMDGARAVADFYVLSGVKFNGGSYASSDDFIRQVRGGVAHDGSVGFYFKNIDPTRFAGVRCNICGENLYRWDCPHIPGMAYDQNEEGGTVNRVVCTGTVMNAHAAEWSSVYSGSTPGAAIIKAQYEAAAGRMKPEAIRFMESHYRGLKLSLPSSQFALGGIEGERTMEPKPTDEPKRHPDDVAAQNNMRTALTTAGFADNQDMVAAVRAITDELVTLRKLKDDQPELQRKATDGDLYRKSLIDEVVREGVRAFGTDYDEEGERKLLATAELETVKKRAAQNKLAGDKLFPGGRVTTDGEENVAPARRAEPVSAYRV